MCRFAISIIAALSAALISIDAGAQRINVNDNHRRSMGNKRPVEQFGRLDRSSNSSERNHSGDRRHHGVHKKHSHHYYWPGYRRAYRYPYGYDYGYPYGYYPYRYWNAPIYVPAETVYGPGAVQRFMGVDHWSNNSGANNQPRQAPNVIVQQGNGAADEGNPAGGGPFARNDGGDADRPNGVSPQAANLAWRFIGFGDAQFATGDFLEANVRYRKAVAAAPRMGAPYFRQGYALMASGRWDLAAESIRRGLEHQPDWPSSGFSNAELYGDQPDLKTKHIQQLAEATEEDQNDVDRLLLMGVMLHFDGKPDRARPFFERVNQLTPGGDPAAAAFLK